MIIHKLIKRPGTKHLYEMNVKLPDGTKQFWAVEANNRSQAARLAEREGVEVCDVNMVG